MRRAGTYGKSSTRQLYACIAPDGTRHRFAPVLPREHTTDGICAHCDTPLEPHTGPVVGRDYVHRLRLVTDALARVGAGVSYTRASNRARVAAGRDPVLGAGAGHLAAEWIDAWGPAVIETLRETDWPETLVLDSTDFWWTNTRTGDRRREFAVLVAYGYPGPRSRNPRPRPWGIHAAPTARASDWVELLAGLDLPGPPRTIVSDDNRAVTAAVDQMWPAVPGPSLPAPFLHLCEHHLRENAVAALAADGVDHYGSVRMHALNTAFHSPAGWEAFTATLTAKQPTSRAWVARAESRVQTQVEVRHLLPLHYSTAAAEAVAADLKALLEQRSFSFRNKARTNRLLGLVRLHLAGLDDPDTYHTVLRTYAAEHGGRGRPQGGNRDPRGTASLRT